MRRLVFVVALFWASVANAQLFPFGGGGSTFNPASPGAIGGTASSTGQFTILGVGTSPATLPGTTGFARVGDSTNGGVFCDLDSHGGLIVGDYFTTGGYFGFSGVNGAPGSCTSPPAIGSAAVVQNTSGDTIVNAATGQAIHFRINNGSDLLAISATNGVASGIAAGISGGGALATGSNAFAGRITGLAATSNILTPGFTCTNAVTCAFQDDTTAGGVKVTAQGTTTITFSATASDTADYHCGCR